MYQVQDIYVSAIAKCNEKGSIPLIVILNLLFIHVKYAHALCSNRRTFHSTKIVCFLVQHMWDLFIFIDG